MNELLPIWVVVELVPFALEQFRWLPMFWQTVCAEAALAKNSMLQRKRVFFMCFYVFEWLIVPYLMTAEANEISPIATKWSSHEKCIDTIRYRATLIAIGDTEVGRLKCLLWVDSGRMQPQSGH